jgi:hypothetical protein
MDTAAVPGVAVVAAPVYLVDAELVREREALLLG